MFQAQSVHKTLKLLKNPSEMVSLAPNCDMSVPGRCEGRDAWVSASLGDSTGSSW